jgi:excisionase family DNA binding protein
VSGRKPDTAAAEDVMTNREVVESGDTRETSLSNTGAPADADGLPRRLLTTYEVAEFVGCHEETVRRAYLRGLLVSQRFGARCRRFRREDVLDWIGRGAPTMARVRAERGIGHAAARGEGGS